MVRGLRPRNRIRWAVDATVHIVGNAGASGHAQRPQPPRPGSHATAGRRGRRPLRWVRDVGISIVVNKRVNAANLHPPLGSPERGAVAALCAVTEGLVQRGCGVITLPVNPHRAGVEARPYGVWEVGAWNWRRRSSDGRRTGDGAPYEARRNVKQQPHVIPHPTEGASRTPPPTVVACGYVSAEP